MKLTLSTLPEKLAICHFEERSQIPEWAKKISFCSITRTSDELSIVAPQDKIPGGILAEKNWRAFKVKGPLGFTLTGIVSFLSKLLADAGISIFYISTYETDYFLVKEEDFEKAKKILRKFCKIEK